MIKFILHLIQWCRPLYNVLCANLYHQKFYLCNIFHMRIRVTVGVILLIPVTLEGSFCTYTRQGKTSYNELLWAPTRCVCEFSGGKSHGITLQLCVMFTQLIMLNVCLLMLYDVLNMIIYGITITDSNLQKNNLFLTYRKPKTHSTKQNGAGSN